MNKADYRDKEAYIAGFQEGFMAGLEKGREENKFCKDCGNKTYTIAKEEN